MSRASPPSRRAGVIFLYMYMYPTTDFDPETARALRANITGLASPHVGAESLAYTKLGEQCEFNY